MRTSLAKHDTKATSLALRRATHLAIDLVLEHVDADDATAGLAELAKRNILDALVAERLGRRFPAADEREDEPDLATVIESGSDLDRLLRSLEHGAAMPELPFGPLVTPEMPAAQSRAALTVSGRHVVVAARGGEGLVFIDDRPVGRPFAMFTAPTSKAEVHRDPSGTTRIVWESEGLEIELGPDFATAKRLAPT
ncbi:MAG: hypothetical protein JO257_35265 [Deltaproteobacteria bacterium]|nr:hypothetical protein [Deltaproteobacteria bacterium]